MKNTRNIRVIRTGIGETFWYNGDKKENLITVFLDIRKIRITDSESGERLRE